MYKVIVERPRRGGGWTKPGREPRDPDEQPAREGMRERLGRNRKSLNENLRPLERWLDRQAGRPWDAVYSELCRHVDRRNTVQQHIHQHLNDLVEIQAYQDQDGVYVVRSWRGRVALAESRCDLYVDPRNGCLMRNEAAFAHRVRKRDEHRLAVHAHNAGWREGVRTVDCDLQLHRLDGIWYRIKLAPVPPPRRSKRNPGVVLPGRATDAVFHAPVVECRNKRRTLYGRSGVYAVSKRQLSQSELVAHRLRNGHDPDPFPPELAPRRLNARKRRAQTRADARYKEH